LNNREKAWQTRNVKPNETIQERMKEMTFIEPWSPEAIERAEEFASKYGRAWYIFQGVPIRHHRKHKQWIMQYYVTEEDAK
tara:strand:- start:26434 stop:26676 length:243 start_codon:yes stop_codon:yes gene_type:complete